MVALPMFDKLAKLKWHFIHRRFRTPFYTYLLWDGTAKHYDKQISFKYETKNFIYLDQDIAIAEPDWERTRRRVKRQLQKSPQWLLQLLLRNKKVNDKNEHFAKKLTSLDYPKITRSDLIKLWKHYIEGMNVFVAPLILPLVIEPDMEQQLKSLIKLKWGESQTDPIFQALTTPIKQGATLEQHASLLRLAILYHQGRNIDRPLDQHLYNFSWIKNNSFDGKFATKAETKKRLQSIAPRRAVTEYKTYQAKIKKQRRDFNRYRTAFKGNKQALTLIDTLQESIYYRSWRTERYYRNAYFLQSFFKHTAKSLGVKPNDLFYLISPEIVKLLRASRSADQKWIKERKQGYMVLADGKTVIYSGSDLTLAKRKIKLFSSFDRTELKGNAAFPGKVQGRVVIVHSKFELDKIKQGDILVTTSTTVNYVPYLKKVKGIITEEGGVLSHASVISRELHIPCIVGVRQAVILLHDGDRVTMDAWAGTVAVNK